jgi:hypothetical protein
MTITELKLLINDLIDTNTNDFPDVKKVRFLNKAQNKIVNLILENDVYSYYDDDNWTDLSMGYLNLDTGVNNYNLRQDENLANLLYVTKLLAKDKYGNYQELQKINIDSNEASPELTESTNTGSPLTYRMNGKTIIVSPTPDYDSTDGLKILFIRTPQEILESDTTKEPGIPSTFHYLLALMTCYDFARAKQMTTKNDLFLEIAEEKQKLGIHVSDEKDIKIILQATPRNYE